MLIRQPHGIFGLSTKKSEAKAYLVIQNQVTSPPEPGGTRVLREAAPWPAKMSSLTKLDSSNSLLPCSPLAWLFTPAYFYIIGCSPPWIFPREGCLQVDSPRLWAHMCEQRRFLHVQVLRGVCPGWGWEALQEWVTWTSSLLPFCFGAFSESLTLLLL